jgi:hypothetical protein
MLTQNIEVLEVSREKLEENYALLKNDWSKVVGSLSGAGRVLLL